MSNNDSDPMNSEDTRPSSAVTTNETGGPPAGGTAGQPDTLQATSEANASSANAGPSTAQDNVLSDEVQPTIDPQNIPETTAGVVSTGEYPI